jgi:hypothetical protein
MLRWQTFDAPPLFARAKNADEAVVEDADLWSGILGGAS